MKSILEQLSLMTVVVADTGDLDAINNFFQEMQLLILHLYWLLPRIQIIVQLIDEALENAIKILPKAFSKDSLVKEAIDQVSVLFGKEILGIISGRVSTEVDARLSFDTEATVNKARKLIQTL